MALIKVTNLTTSQVTVPAPLNVTLRAGENKTVTIDDLDDLAVAEDLSTMLTKNLINIETMTDDPNIDDRLETPISPIIIENTEAALLAKSPQDGVLGYARDTFKYFGRADGDWEDFGGGGGITVPQDITSVALSFDIDYNDPTAVDPGPDDIFETQQQINDFLAAAGTTKFKHIMAVWDALPTFLNHTIDFNLAYGIHRPRNPEPAPAAWFFGAYNNKVKLFGPRFFLRMGEESLTPPNGPTAWPTVVANQTIATDNRGAAGDPNVVVSGTPYTAGALKGYFAWWGATFAALIHDNTNNTVRILRNPGGTIIPGTTQLRIVKPGIILRNSYNDISQAKGVAVQNDVIHSQFGMNSFNYMIEPFGATGYLSRGRNDTFGVLVDDAGVKNQFSVDSSAIGFDIREDVFPTFNSQFWECGHRGTRLATVPGNGGQSMQMTGRGELAHAFPSGYYGGGSGVPMTFRETRVRFFQNVVAELNSTNSNPGILVEGNSTNTSNNGRPVWKQIGASSNKYPEVRGAFVGIDFIRAMALGWSGNFVFNGIFGSGQAAIVIRDDCDLDLSGCTLLNGAITNVGRGIDIIGPNSTVKLSAGTVVSGSAGETRIDGISKTYAQIAAMRRPSTQPGGLLDGRIIVEDVEQGTTVGTATLTYTTGTTTITYTAPGDTAGPAINIGFSGIFLLKSNNGKWIRIFVGTLPTGSEAQTFSLARGIYRNPGLNQPLNSIEKL